MTALTLCRILISCSLSSLVGSSMIFCSSWACWGATVSTAAACAAARPAAEAAHGLRAGRRAACLCWGATSPAPEQLAVCICAVWSARRRHRGGARWAPARHEVLHARPQLHVSPPRHAHTHGGGAMRLGFRLSSTRAGPGRAGARGGRPRRRARGGRGRAGGRLRAVPGGRL